MRLAKFLWVVVRHSADSPFDSVFQPRRAKHTVEVAMSLIQEIEDGAAGNEMPITTLLRKCLVLAHRLGSKPAVDWIEWELNGYPQDAAVPDYRKLPLVIKANLVDLTRRATGFAIEPAYLGPDSARWTSHDYRASISAVEEVMRGAEGTVAFQMGNLSIFLQSRKFTTMEITSAWGETSSSQLKHIIETVRTRVLMFALELAKEFPTAGEIRSQQPKDQERVTQIFTNNIYGPANVVGTANASTISLNLSHGDFASLSQTLEAHGVAVPDIKDLKAALDQEPEAKSGNFGPKVATWIGGMIKKAAEGTWKMATGAAGDLLGKALGKNYGLS
jgi:hypothetical protein